MQKALDKGPRRESPGEAVWGSSALAEAKLDPEAVEVLDDERASVRSERPEGTESVAALEQSEPTSAPATGEDQIERPKLVKPTIHPAYDRIVQRLFAFRKSQQHKTILLVSAVAGEGTTTIARRLSSALGQDGRQRVVLVDANLRSPALHEAFFVERAGGLSDVVEGRTTLTKAIRHGVDTGVSLLTSGNPEESPAQLLGPSAVTGVVTALISLFDWVIIDGPPVTLYSEASSLASAAGGAILVVQAERTRWEVAEQAKRALEDSGVNVLGAVLNRRRYHIPDFLYRRL
jgi:capsular exopolysaccharide synthesis family protein